MAGARAGRMGARAGRTGSRGVGNAAANVVNGTLSNGTSTFSLLRTDESGDGVGVGVGIGSRPAPGSRLDKVGAGAKRDRALASSGILPVEATILMLL